MIAELLMDHAEDVHIPGPRNYATRAERALGTFVDQIVSLQNLYVEDLIPTLTIFGNRAFRKVNKVIR